MQPVHRFLSPEVGGVTLSPPPCSQVPADSLCVLRYPQLHPHPSQGPPDSFPFVSSPDPTDSGHVRAGSRRCRRFTGHSERRSGRPWLFSPQVSPVSTKSGSRPRASSAVRTSRARSPGRNTSCPRAPHLCSSSPHGKAGVPADSSHSFPVTIPGALRLLCCFAASQLPAFPLLTPSLEGQKKEAVMITVERGKRMVS